MAKLNLSSPWVIMYNKINAMFKNDTEVHVIYDNNNNVKLYVENADKAYALDRLLIHEHRFGGNILNVIVIPPNDKRPSEDLENESYEILFDVAFDGNSAYCFSQTLPPIFTNPMTYVVFKKEVVQFWTDDLSDYYGQCSTLYQNIANEIFTAPSVYYSTNSDVTYKLNWP